MNAYHLDSTNVATEIFDNEAVLINIPEGKYYSVRGNTGIRILEILQQPTNVEKIIAIINNEFESASEQDLATGIEEFINHLVSENIVISGTEVISTEIAEVHSRLSYEKPELEVFDDMQELIMLDPVHDVESFKGWPQKKEEVANG